jgi:hypothetical protein
VLIGVVLQCPHVHSHQLVSLVSSQMMTITSGE